MKLIRNFNRMNFQKTYFYTVSTFSNLLVLYLVFETKYICEFNTWVQSLN